MLADSARLSQEFHLMGLIKKIQPFKGPGCAPARGPLPC